VQSTILRLGLIAVWIAAGCSSDKPKVQDLMAASCDVDDPEEDDAETGSSTRKPTTSPTSTRTETPTSTRSNSDSASTNTSRDSAEPAEPEDSEDTEPAQTAVAGVDCPDPKKLKPDFTVQGNIYDSDTVWKGVVHVTGDVCRLITS
jgi:hypothetical protein